MASIARKNYVADKSDFIFLSEKRIRQINKQIFSDNVWYEKTINFFDEQHSVFMFPLYL